MDAGEMRMDIIALQGVLMMLSTFRATGLVPARLKMQ
jgi:hypothetical protein